MFEKWEDIVTHKGLYQISAVCNHKKNYKTAGGYHWHYVERRIKNENSR